MFYMSFVTEVQTDRALLKTVLHYVCATVPAACLGKVKLYKCFYYLDMFHHAVHGHPVVGLTYVRAPNGPLAPAVDVALRELKADGLISVDLVDYHGFKKWHFEAISPAPQLSLSEDQIGLLDDIKDWVCKKNTAKSISEFSHNLAWESVENGQVIPYRTAIMIFPQEPSEEALDWANQMASELETSPGEYLDIEDERAFRGRVFSGYLH